MNNDKFYTLLITQHSKSANSTILSKKEDIVNFKHEVIDRTSFLPMDTHIKLRMWCILNNILGIPKCYVCDNPTDINNTAGKFKKFCSKACQSNSSRIISPKEFSDYDWLFTNHHILKKTPTEMARSVGLLDSNYVQVMLALESNDIPYIDWKNKIQLADKDFIKNLYVDKNYTMAEVAEELHTSKSTIQVHIKKLGIEPTPSNSYPRKTYKRSKGEIEVAEFLSDFTEVITNDRSIVDTELDIYLPEYKVAIEFNGLYYHSYYRGNKSKEYHSAKTKLCEEKGINLFHIWDYEWNDPNLQSIWKSLLLSKIQKHSTRIFARKCEIRNVDIDTKNTFLNDNHLQGKDISSKKIGLFANDELVALMTFNTPRFNRAFDWELVRFCSKKNTTIIGGASKILSHFRKNNKGSIISYADRRYSSGSLYKTLNFELWKSNKPSYKYTKGYTSLINRYSFTKKRIQDKYPDIYDINKTEEIMMLDLGFDRVYDCGTLSFILQ